jgi:hypothetical protein
MKTGSQLPDQKDTREHSDLKRLQSGACRFVLVQIVLGCETTLYAVFTFLAGK